MKINLKKLAKDHGKKLLVATIVPGGFIALAAYELGKYIGKKDIQAESKEHGDK